LEEIWHGQGGILVEMANLVLPYLNESETIHQEKIRYIYHRWKETKEEEIKETKEEEIKEIKEEEIKETKEEIKKEIKETKEEIKKEVKETTNLIKTIISRARMVEDGVHNPADKFPDFIKEALMAKGNPIMIRSIRPDAHLSHMEPRSPLWRQR